uniref:Uncharacterized protein n=1 Tax=Globodera rostochiensis TaxID=31243 RepID=A0A914HC97_GLORO
MKVPFFICFFTLQLILINVAGGSDTAGEPKLRKKRNTDVDVLGFINVHAPSRKNVNVGINDGDRSDGSRDKLLNVDVQGHKKNVNVDVGSRHDGDRYDSDKHKLVNVDVQGHKKNVNVDVGSRHDGDRYDSDKHKRVNVDVRRNHDGDRHSNNQRDVNVDVQVPDVKVDVDREREGKRVHLKLLDKLKKYRSEESGERRRVVKIERERDGKRKTVYVGENRSD